jgi:glycosyltransferase involved in cell wall biosynthesis
MKKFVLLIAFHFPPVGFSSGVQRTLSFTRQLPKLGWQPLVLTVHPRAYRETNDGQLRDIPDDVVVKRAFALDTSRHLSIRGRYLRFMAIPDHWVSWCIGGIYSGVRLCKKYRPALIWSTYPIASAHLIGMVLHKITGLPWVADFRDVMTEEEYPSSPLQRKVYRWIEQKTLLACSKAVFTTPGAVEMYRTRYPELPANHWMLIPNGYDEKVFDEVERALEQKDQSELRDRVVLLHSGIVYPAERDPSNFFQALSQLKKEGSIDRTTLSVQLRACGHETILGDLLRDNDIEDLVELLPGIPYREAISELMTADALLILQASNCNNQVPAKVYEYFRTGRPVLSLTDAAGDTAKVLMKAGLRDIVPLDDTDAIIKGLPKFLQKVRNKECSVAKPEAVQRSSRRYSAEMLSEIFAGIIK